jgi:hypothetical protein
MKYNRVGALYAEGAAESGAGSPPSCSSAAANGKGAGVAHTVPSGLDPAVGALDEGGADGLHANTDRALSPERRPPETLIKALVRAHRWRRRIESGRAKSITDLAEQKSITDDQELRAIAG